MTFILIQLLTPLSRQGEIISIKIDRKLFARFLQTLPRQNLSDNRGRITALGQLFTIMGIDPRTTGVVQTITVVTDDIYTDTVRLVFYRASAQQALP